MSSTVFWVLTPERQKGTSRNRHKSELSLPFASSGFLSELLFEPEDGGDMFL
jgi:hypothetical protein